jgi:hypothetical protein
LPNRQLHAFSLLSLETSLARFSSPHHYPELCFLPPGMVVHASLSPDLHDFHLLSFLIDLGGKWAVAYNHDIIFLNTMTTFNLSWGFWEESLPVRKIFYSLLTTRRQIGDFLFSVCVAGRAQFPICNQSLLIGGNCRVGLEDNLYLEKGKMAKSNAEQVAKMVRIAKEFGDEAATPDEARKILGPKGIDKVNY